MSGKSSKTGRPPWVTWRGGAGRQQVHFAFEQLDAAFRGNAEGSRLWLAATAKTHRNYFGVHRPYRAQADLEAAARFHAPDKGKGAGLFGQNAANPAGRSVLPLTLGPVRPSRFTGTAPVTMLRQIATTRSYSMVPTSSALAN
jgi:hypothetical protein